MPVIEVPSFHVSVVLPVGFKDTFGRVSHVAEVRAVTREDELSIGMAREYEQHPNDAVYKLLLLARCVTRLGELTPVTLSDIQQLHDRDIRALELALYTLTYGSDAPAAEDGGAPGV